MASNARPPVEEVAISLAIELVGKLAGPELSVILGDWWPTHQVIQVQPPYVMPSEFPQQVAAPSIFQIQLPQQTRFMFVSDDESEIVQIQPTYIGLNWRRGAGSEYPGHEAFKARFQSLLLMIAENAGTEIKPTGAELTYVNILDEENLTPSDLTLLPQSVGDMKISQVSVYRNLQQQGEFIGRAYAQLARGFDPAKQEANLYLSLISRSAPLEQPKGEETALDHAFNFIALAHNEVSEIFKQLLTAPARQKWGLE